MREMYKRLKLGHPRTSVTSRDQREPSGLRPGPTWNQVFYAIVVSVVLAAAQEAPKVAPLSFADALPTISALDVGVPKELKASDSAIRSAAWQKWTLRYESETVARLARGDEDSLANFLLFGTSFTSQPRLTAEVLKSAAAPAGSAGSKPREILQKRIEDFLQAVSAPGANERLNFLHSLMAGRGYVVSNPAGRAAAGKYVFEILARVLLESEHYAEALRAARAADATTEFAERSTLFRDRGISLDTSLLPDFAVEETLRAMSARGLLGPGTVRRVAIVGPGLDFTDKGEGYDVYPPQTIQPFALMDSLIRLGLARADELELTAIDVSPRVIAHIKRARQRAARGEPYTISLLMESQVPWKAEFNRYWKEVGNKIGNTVVPAALPAGLRGVEIRSVRVRPGVVGRIRPAELNIVTRRLDLPDRERLDLIVATNVFVYFGVFEQCLALANLERMLHPGGFLISNNALLELPASKMRAVDYQTVIYSDRPADGDHLVYFRRSD